MHQKQLEGFEIRFWRYIEKIFGADRLKYKEVLTYSQEETGNPSYRKIRKPNWTGNILRRNCLLKHLIRRKADGTES